MEFGVRNWELQGISFDGDLFKTIFGNKCLIYTPIDQFMLNKERSLTDYLNVFNT
jgi:hypothetical protein